MSNKQSSKSKLSVTLVCLFLALLMVGSVLVLGIQFIMGVLA